MSEKARETLRWAVYIKNFTTNEWDVMKLRYDPRTEKEGLAIYKKKDEALFTEQIANALGGATIKTRVSVYTN